MIIISTNRNNVITGEILNELREYNLQTNHVLKLRKFSSCGLYKCPTVNT